MSVINMDDYRKKQDQKEDTESSLLTDEEVKKLIFILTSTSPNGITEEDALEVVNWAEEIRFKEILLNMVLDDMVLISFDEEGELVFSIDE